jgi:GNAT superfamily N-acetyltransferase
MRAVARLIKHNELSELLSLYRQLHPDDPDVFNDKTLRDLWEDIYNDPNLYYIVVEVDGEIVSSCNISIIKNLTHNLRPYALVENVITAFNQRKKGYASMALKKALEIATENNCYKVMLLTGSKKEETLKFYENAGFVREIKTGFIKIL